MTDATAIFQQERTRLRAVAYRVLGSVHEADDAVQEAWLRLERSEVEQIDNLPGWLTTVVSRICLDQLRARAARREDLGVEPVAAVGSGPEAEDPARVAEQADQVGRALMIVMDSLGPAERLAFCLHDLFGLSFDEVAVALGRNSAACRQLASRARRRVRGQHEEIERDRVRQQEIVDAFLDAAKNAKFDRLMSLLHPDAVVSADAAAAAMGSPALRGANQIAQFFNGSAKAARRATLDGYAAALWSLRGETKVVFAFTVEDGKISSIELLAADLDRLDLRSLPARRNARRT